MPRKLTKSQLAKIHSSVKKQRGNTRSSIHNQVIDMQQTGMSDSEIKRLIIRDTKIYINDYL
jgi:hypothetical protein